MPQILGSAVEGGRPNHNSNGKGLGPVPAWDLAESNGTKKY